MMVVMMVVSGDNYDFDDNDETITIIMITMMIIMITIMYIIIVN